jgi:hypothetical protein
VGPVLEKVRREVNAFHCFRELSERLIEINEEICERRPIEEGAVKRTSLGGSGRKSSGRSTAS